uniref:Retrovirus-related Pol polyprotein from transposon TNT 1-94-like beta-barrel domain-containing protein n=1 Tax=Brassica oleracea var. oleracea TaxID=109376 RepID=A0A0D3A8K0_BRAOL
MGNDAMVQVAGISDICLETSIGTKLVLKDVKHVPDIMMNLISTEKLDDEGYFSYTVVAKVSKNAINAVENDSAMEL